MTGWRASKYNPTVEEQERKKFLHHGERYKTASVTYRNFSVSSQQNGEAVSCLKEKSRTAFPKKVCRPDAAVKKERPHSMGGTIKHPFLPILGRVGGRTYILLLHLLCAHLHFTAAHPTPLLFPGRKKCRDKRRKGERGEGPCCYSVAVGSSPRSDVKKEGKEQM